MGTKYLKQCITTCGQEKRMQNMQSCFVRCFSVVVTTVVSVFCRHSFYGQHFSDARHLALYVFLTKTHVHSVFIRIDALGVKTKF